MGNPEVINIYGLRPLGIDYDLSSINKGVFIKKFTSLNSVQRSVKIISWSSACADLCDLRIVQ